METNKLGINFEEVSDERSYDLLPAGAYNSIITGAEMKTPKSGKSDYLSIEYTIIDGEFKDRKVWDSLSIHHENDTPRNIARSRLKALALATGIDIKKFSDPEELLNRMLIINLGQTAAKDNFPAKNTVKKVESITSETKMTAPKEKTLDLKDDIPDFL